MIPASPHAKPFPRKRSPAGRTLLSLALGLALQPALAQTAPTVTWQGDDGGLWRTGPWSGITGAPVAGNDVQLLAPAGSFPGSQTVTYNETAAPAYASLTIDATATVAMTLDQSANTLHAGTLTLGEAGSGLYVLSGSGRLTVDADLTLGVAGSGTATQQAGTAGIGGDLLLGTASGGQGTYAQSGGTLTITGRTVLGLTSGGSGSFTQDNADGASTHTTGELVLGEPAGASGSYALTDAGTGATLSLNVSGNTVIGGDGSGSFSQSGGLHAASGIYLGGGPGYTDVTASGSYTLTGGTVSTAGLLVVGQNGTGSFTHSGGSVSADLLILGNSGSSSGNSFGQYFLSGSGTITSNYTTVGAFGRGVFTQSGGTHTVNNDLVIGDGPATGGTPVRGGVYTLTGGTLAVANDSIVGDGNGSFAAEPGGSGSFTQTGGTHTVGHDLIVGNTGTDGGGTGSYTLGGAGTLSVSGTLRIGAGVGTGSFTQTAGSASAAQLEIGSGNGRVSAGSGSYTLSGGTLDIVGQSFIGNGLTGTFTQTGGSFTTDYIDVGIASDSIRLATYSISGGTATARVNLVVGSDTAGLASFVQTGGSVFVQSTSFGMYINGSYSLDNTDGPARLDVTHDAVIGDTSNGSFTQAQGAVTVGHDLIIGNGADSFANGTYEISGGSLTVGGNVIIGRTTGSGNVAQYTQSGGTATVSGDFVVSNQGMIGTSTVDISAGSLTVHGTTTNSRIVIGGFSSFNLTGGSVNADGLFVEGGTAGGSFQQSGGTLRITGSGSLGRTVIGVLGFGSYTQTGGTHETPELVLGTGSVASGALGGYTLDNGELTVHGTSWIGAVTSGNFDQTGGTFTTNQLRIASDSGSEGFYTQRGGTLNVASVAVVGDAGAGRLQLINGSITIGGNLMIGRNSIASAPTSGIFIDGGTLMIGGDLLAGNFSFGGISQSNGAVTVAGQLLLGGWQDTAALTGNWADGDGSYTLDGGSLDVAMDAVVGNLGNGRFFQRGGTFTVANLLIIGNQDAANGDFEQSGGTTQVNGDLIVGRQTGSTGSYALSAGRLNVSGDAWIGQSGSGTFTQTGGLVLIGGDLLIGAEAGGVGRYRLDSGTLDVSGTIVLGGTTTADGGSGELTLSGSANLYANGLDLRPGGTLGGLGGGITLGDSAQGNAAADTIMINRGGMLAGNGTIPGSVTVNDGGIVSPGNSIGTLSVGDIVFNSGSTLRAEVDAAGNADLLHASGSITINGGTLSIVALDGSLSAGVAYTVLSADGSLTGSFTNVTSSLPLLAITATYTGTSVTLSIPTPDDNAARSPLDLIGGSPVSLLGRMTLADVEAGFLLDPLLPGIDEGQAGIGARIGRYYADGYRQTYEEMPLRYAWKLDSGLTVLAELPIANVTTSGNGVHRQDRSYGFGGGLRVPVAAGWDLKPMFRYGTVVDEDWEHIGSLASASLTSHFRTTFGDGYEFGADNMVGYFKSVGGRVEGLNAGYRLHEVALHNAVRVGGPLEGTFLGSGARWQAWISDTRFLGSDLAADNFQRIGIAATTRVRVGDRYSENLSLGLHYTQSAGGDHGVELNFGYRF